MTSACTVHNPLDLQVDQIRAQLKCHTIPYLKKDIVALKKIHRRATELAHGLNKMSYEQRLEALGLYSLQQRRLKR